MNHPPLPPDCRFEVCINDFGWLDVKTHFGFIDNSSADGRFVISCIFNRLWLDEYQRLCDINGGSDDEYSMRVWQRIQADDYAKAWQEWGNRK